LNKLDSEQKLNMNKFRFWTKIEYEQILNMKNLDYKKIWIWTKIWN
jgi:hypothetical protein